MLKRTILKKFLIIILLILITSFTIMPNKAQAVSFLQKAGGIILDSAMDLLVFIGDCVMGILQNNFISTEEVILVAESKDFSEITPQSIIAIVLGIVAIVVAVVVAVASWGTLSWASVAAIGASIKLIGGVILIGGAGIAATVWGTSELIEGIKGKFDLPMIRYTPYEIFSNSIPVFDINFINPMEDKIYHKDASFNEGDGPIAYYALSNAGYGKEKDSINDTILAQLYDNYQLTIGVRGLDGGGMTISGATAQLILIVDDSEWVYADTLEELLQDNKLNILSQYVVGESPDAASEVINRTSWELDLKPRNNMNGTLCPGVNHYDPYSCGKTTINGENYELFEYEYEPDDSSNLCLFSRYKDDPNTDTVIVHFTPESGYNIDAGKNMNEDDFIFLIKQDIARILKEEYIDGEISDFDSQQKDLNDEIKEKVKDLFANQKAEDKVYKSSAAILQSSIATWYKVLRRVALVGLLSVLVYVGIRIIIAAPTGKAKYKNMFLNWIAAVCILFVLHYLMVFIVTLSQDLTKIFTETGEENIIVKLPYNTTIDGKGLPGAEGNGEAATKDNPPVWSCSFTGYARLLAGAYDGKDDQMGTMNLAYGLIYIIMVIYTCIFTFMYLRRVLYMAFLTMIAPLIALTYPLDKLKDGKAQALGLWLREYIFNALIQPVHLILYVMIISNVMEYVTEHPVYAIVAIGFLLPAEGIIKKMFGFGGLETLKNLTDAAGGAAVMSAVNSLSGKGRNNSTPKIESNSNVRTADESNNNIELPEFKQDVSSQTAQEQAIKKAYQELKNQGLNNDEIKTKLKEEFNNDELIESVINTDSNSFGSKSNTGSGEFRNSTSQGTSFVPKDRGINSKIAAGLLNVGRKYNKRSIKAKPLRTVGRFTAMAFGGATLGLLGLASGISSGNIGDTIKFTSAGMAVGSGVGKNIGNKLMDEASYLKDGFIEGYKGREEYNNDLFDKNFRTSQDLVDMINDRDVHPEMSGGIGKEIIRSRQIRREAEEYHSRGITDKEQISICIKNGLSPEEGQYAVELAKMMKSKKINTDKKKQDFYLSYKKKMQEHTDGKFDKKVDNIWDVASKIRFK